MRPPVALAVAAHDPLGGAGLAADLSTFAALGVHGACAVTAVTAQRLATVDRVVSVDIELVDAQLDGIITDLEPGGLKTGLLGSAAVVESIAGRVAAGTLPAPVVDPVLVDGRGQRFVDEAIERAYRERLFPLAQVLTPNLAEAGLLVGRPLATVDDLIGAADALAALGAAHVVVTGGRLGGNLAVDVIVAADGTVDLLTGNRFTTPNVRGSGCTFAAAIAARLTLGEEAPAAIHTAKEFVADRLRESTDWSFGAGGPISHRFDPHQGTSAHSSP